MPPAAASFAPLRVIRGPVQCLAPAPRPTPHSCSRCKTASTAASSSASVASRWAASRSPPVRTRRGLRHRHHQLRLGQARPTALGRVCPQRALPDFFAPLRLGVLALNVQTRNAWVGTATACLGTVAACPATDAGWEGTDAAWGDGDTAWEAGDTVWGWTDTAWVGSDAPWGGGDTVWEATDMAWVGTDMRSKCLPRRLLRGFRPNSKMEWPRTGRTAKRLASKRTGWQFSSAKPSPARPLGVLGALARLNFGVRA